MGNRGLQYFYGKNTEGSHPEFVRSCWGESIRQLTGKRLQSAKVLLIQVRKFDNLWKVMRRLNTSYAKWFQKKNGYIRQVFQGRFHSSEIENESYLLECGRYIERNPVRARIVQMAAGYRWSSVSFYLNGRTNKLITANPLYESLGKTDSARQKAYREYLETERIYESIIDKHFSQI